MSKQNNYTLKGKEQLYICPVGDIHLGSPETNIEYLEYWRNIVAGIKGPKRIYLTGDLMEAATKRLANSAFKVNMSLDDQLEWVIQFFKPLKEDIIFSAIGNHELRLSKDYDLDLMRIVAQALDCDYGNQYLDHFMVNNEPVTVYTAHGKGSSMHHYTAESKIIRDTQTIMADIVIHGHNHRCGHFSIPTRTMNGLRRKHYVFSGAFLGYGGYADSMQLPVLPESFIYLGVNREHRVTPNVFYIDERQPELMSVAGVIL